MARARRAGRNEGTRPPLGHNSLAARAAWYGVAYEAIDRVEIFERDSWICQLCMEPIDSDLRWPDANSPSIDHIVSWANGGAHVRSNVQAAHLQCNIAKGAGRTIAA